MFSYCGKNHLQDMKICVIVLQMYDHLTSIIYNLSGVFAKCKTFLKSVITLSNVVNKFSVFTAFWEIIPCDFMMTTHKTAFVQCNKCLLFVSTNITFASCCTFWATVKPSEVMDEVEKCSIFQSVIQRVTKLLLSLDRNQPFKLHWLHFYSWKEETTRAFKSEF